MRRRTKKSNAVYVHRYRKNLKIQLDAHIAGWKVDDRDELLQHFEGHGIDRFRIGRKYNFNIHSKAYLLELAYWYHKTTGRSLRFYLEKFGVDIDEHPI